MRKDFIGQLKTVLFEPRDLDLVIGVDDPGAENDRRHVALARCPETHNEPYCAGGKVSLIIMSDDRRIEQRC